MKCITQLWLQLPVIVDLSPGFHNEMHQNMLYELK
jgi:hypothetical protein